MSPKKTQAVQIGLPTNVHDVQVLWDYQFYRRFVPVRSNNANHDCTLRKDVKFEWLVAAEQSLQQLKEAFGKDVILRHPDETKEFLVEVDASDYAVRGGSFAIRRRQAASASSIFFSADGASGAQYEIYDKELLAITTCLKEWRHFLQGSHTPFTILTDHKNLEYFMTTKQLTRRQSSMSLFLAEFRFNLSYRPGSHNGLASTHCRLPQTDAWLPNITDTLRENCVADLPHYQMDLPETKAGKRHIVTAIDYATRWVVAKAVPNRDSATVASFLYDLMVSYGSPFEILTDRGSAFLSEGVKEFEALQRIRHQLRHPTIHAQMEWLSDACNEQMEERAEFTARSLGRNWSSPIGQHTHAPRRKQEAMRIRNKWDPDSDDYYFKIGDMVKLKNHTKNKFEFDWKGPYHIVDVGYPGTYWIWKPLDVDSTQP
ncbi:hypothetical protein BASA83_013621 [Batrachochytrium salamandrivorans]|nr:hypothetical protein BASA83_013621 [Batrachochytrium salamandrivorans]